MIEDELRTKGRWEGQLVHVLRDGSRVRVVSHWVTEQSPHLHDGSINVIEVNSPLNASSGSFREELLSLLNQSKCPNGQSACPRLS
ncbi:hypothetical protein COMA2_210024 [Candidatus Nitrospira nitrificans]|uniref:Uncharacterized protein n=1 Tax=Candidatus Nitrospira nitrificans TaxID=1742973 RepID=A0A0S4LHU4_9BACT|nr:hypothetical protein COMA2_210024 [Candidatus Nitrospira nitrificans]